MDLRQTPVERDGQRAIEHHDAAIMQAEKKSVRSPRRNCGDGAGIDSVPLTVIRGGEALAEQRASEAGGAIACQPDFGEARVVPVQSMPGHRRQRLQHRGVSTHRVQHVVALAQPTTRLQAAEHTVRAFVGMPFGR